MARLPYIVTEISGQRARIAIDQETRTILVSAWQSIDDEYGVAQEFPLDVLGAIRWDSSERRFVFASIDLMARANTEPPVIELYEHGTSANKKPMPALGTAFWSGTASG